jgi:hypothetical protein
VGRFTNRTKIKLQNKLEIIKIIYLQIIPLYRRLGVGASLNKITSEAIRGF